jgi:hypothetical protein
MTEWAVTSIKPSVWLTAFVRRTGKGTYAASFGLGFVAVGAFRCFRPVELYPGLWWFKFQLREVILLGDLQTRPYLGMGGAVADPVGEARNEGQ